MKDKSLLLLSSLKLNFNSICSDLKGKIDQWCIVSVSDLLQHMEILVQVQPKGR